MTQSIRIATAADFSFIHAVAGRPDYARFVVDEDDDALAAHLASPDRTLVVWQPDGTPEGFALFCELDNPAGRTELRRLALAQTDRGRGRPFLDALIGYAFDALGVRRIWLDVAGDNVRAQTLYRRAGFTCEGTLRRHWRRPAGDIADLMLFGLLREEWPS
ncbi:Acetyltransferase (GNAT) family protein [Rhodovulum sp. ES.010]|uniref:GNAT family N-acetyltransferase n=1 Tax=Rhodovulum sp. ES.010 TaxID=1882821 RepID=UPI000927204F|nr:GNAT family protein [Rhodovulum sp. ES.010]SIO08878.1 Acetyltransferase (GNAT) family protein [Rhodovulum sp. ES.010]